MDQPSRLQKMTKARRTDPPKERRLDPLLVGIHAALTRKRRSISSTTVDCRIDQGACLIVPIIHSDACLVVTHSAMKFRTAGCAFCAILYELSVALLRIEPPVFARPNLKMPHVRAMARIAILLEDKPTICLNLAGSRFGGLRARNSADYRMSQSAQMGTISSRLSLTRRSCALRAPAVRAHRTVANVDLGLCNYQGQTIEKAKDAGVVALFA
jgi:hypothetical protein